MLKMTISKIKKLCSVALIPRILRDEVTLSPRKLGRRPLDGFWKMAKSTDSKDRDAECDKCKKLIEMVFGREKPDSVLKQGETNKEDLHLDKIQKVIAPTITVNKKSIESNSLLPVEKDKNDLESADTGFGESVDESKLKNPIKQSALPVNDILQSTTAKATEEQLAQKLETIEEPGLVDTETRKTQGFNTPPKVLGDQENILDSKHSLCMKIGPDEDAMDQIAKKCLGTPPDKIDERILEEMKSCGMLGTGQNKPTSRKSGHCTVRFNNKEPLTETKSEESALCNKNKEKISDSSYNYSTRKRESFYSNYFKGLIGDRASDKKKEVAKITPTEQKEEQIELEDIKTTIREEKPLLVSSDHTSVTESNKSSPVINEEVYNKPEPSEGSTEAITAEIEKPKEIVENVEEIELEEIRVSPTETSRLGIPGETEIDPDFDHKQIKPEILPCIEIFQTADSYEQENIIEPNPHEHVFFANSKYPKDWHFRPDLGERGSSKPSTAISGTAPVIEQRPESEYKKYDTSISSNQKPDEYFDVSKYRMEKVEDDFITTLSEMRALPAFHQYTIISKTDETDYEQFMNDYELFSQKHAPEIYSSQAPEFKLDPDIKKENVSSSINEDISATMGPLPRLKDTEEEQTLTEMLRQVRERNRLQYSQEALETIVTDPVDSNKDKDDKPCKPKPCKPKPKPCPPPCPCPPKCKPKDPCAKFSNTVIGDKIKKAFTLVLQVACKPTLASPNLAYEGKNAVESLREGLNVEDINRIEKLGNFFLSNSPNSKKDQLDGSDIILARDFDPWSPIPSWPTPKKEKKEPFVCPKEGCKVIPPPRLTDPCKENPCANLPKRTFSLIDFEFEPLYLYYDKFKCFLSYL